MQLKLTDSAIERIKQLTINNSNKALRVSVDGGGCSGFMYNYNFVAQVEADDFIMETKGIKVIVDQISQEFLNGCTIDFVQELGSSYFQIINPQATAKCGCGNSFAI